MHGYFLPELTFHFRGLQSVPVSFMLFLDSNITCVCWAFSHYFYNIVLQNLVFEVAVSSFCIEDEGMVATLLHKTRFKQAVKRESTRKLSNFNFQWTKPLYQNNSVKEYCILLYIFQMRKMYLVICNSTKENFSL